MSLLSLIRKPANTAAELRAKLDKLRAADPAAARRDLELERRRLVSKGMTKTWLESKASLPRIRATSSASRTGGRAGAADRGRPAG
jgi:hypothetical protein